MFYDVIMSGFGGQGVLLIGDLLAYAAMRQGQQVTWMPSYGVEMRGGAANCTVVISDKKIGSPLSESPAALIAMSGPGLEKFQRRVKPGGLLLVNTSLASPKDVVRDDIDVVCLAANEMAQELGYPKNANMVVLGAFLAKSGVVPYQSLLDALPAFLPSKRQDLVDGLAASLDRGKRFVEEGE
jgi:2-oxoglutarate ferredoxin oxidoreductase subunit gamma